MASHHSTKVQRSQFISVSKSPIHPWRKLTRSHLWKVWGQSPRLLLEPRAGLYRLLGWSTPHLHVSAFWFLEVPLSIPTVSTDRRVGCAALVNKVKSTYHHYKKPIVTANGPNSSQLALHIVTQDLGISITSWLQFSLLHGSWYYPTINAPISFVPRCGLQLPDLSPQYQGLPVGRTAVRLGKFWAKDRKHLHLFAFPS